MKRSEMIRIIERELPRQTMNTNRVATAILKAIEGAGMMPPAFTHYDSYVGSKHAPGEDFMEDKYEWEEE